jgi:7,8-dihydropterin-6-yl-methyl-4-(beta-D-ribofuranosyl)aminobenzene 5'-phosphate synthase
MLVDTMRALLLLLFSIGFAYPQPPTVPQASSVKVRILSTMLTDTTGVGEWGFAALIEVDGHRILFDTGARPDTVANNLRDLKIDLSSVTDIILSHNHQDHTGGLLTLRRQLAAAHPKALSRAYVASGAFWARHSPDGNTNRNYLRSIKSAYEELGGTFIEIDKPRQILPAVWLTGPVRRIHNERNWSTNLRVQHPDGTLTEDNLPEDSSLVINTAKGLVVVSGCGHAGIINTLEQARREVRNAPIHAAIGGWHLFAASDDHLQWTAGKFKEFGIENFLGAHCTGIEAVYKLRQGTGLTRRQCAVGAVGGGFDLATGIAPGVIAR